MSSIYKKYPILCAVSVLSVCLGYYFHFPAFQDTFIIHDDVRQSLAWISYAADGVLDDSLLVQYSKYIRTPLMNLLYWTGSHFFDPIVLGKIYAVLFFTFSMVVFFWVAWELESLSGACICYGLFAFTYQYFHFASGGFAHGLMMPFMAMTVLAINKQWWKFFLFFLPFEVLINPMAGVVTGFALLIDILIVDYKTFCRKVFWQEKGSFLLAGAIISAAILVSKYCFTPAWYGHMVTKAEMANNILFTSKGRYPVLPVKGLVTEIGEEISVFLVVSLFLFLFAFKNKRYSFPRGLWQLLGASFIGYILANYFLTRLYFPNRYIEYTVPVFFILFLSLFWGKIVNSLPKYINPLVIILLITCSIILEKPDLKPGINTSRIYNRDYYKFLATLPPNVLIASIPHNADNIPVFSRRKVLVNYELAHPWATKYWEVIERRTNDFYDAYFAENKQSVLSVSEKYGITHWVVRPKDFRQSYIQRGDIYFEPFNSRVLSSVENQTYFFMNDACTKRNIYIDNKYCVIETKALQKL